MDRMKMHTPNMADENYRKLAALFPNAVTESIDPETGEVVRAIDADVLRQEISARVVEGREERYQFTWPDKKKAMLAANAPIAATLRPVVADSVGKDGTPGGWDSENLYIEGDNLDVLKLLQETYLGKVKMIYIDPPYNTGNDFVYEDDFSEDAEEYLARSGQFDDQGNRLEQNTESNGRFHTDWLNMIYSRLKMAKNLLSDDGYIFISIDDNEYENLMKICCELFGEANRLADIIWQHSVQSNGYGGKFVSQHNHLIVFSKSTSYLLKNLPRTDEDNILYKNPDNDPRGPWRAGYCVNGLFRPNLRYEIRTPSGKTIQPPDKGWRWSKETLEAKISTGEIVFNEDETGIIHKLYLCDLDGKVPTDFWSAEEAGNTRQATNELKTIFNGKVVFDTPKPVRLICRILSITTNPNDIILDFFSGSATTAHAVMQLNAEDGGHRKFIMVQLPEKTDESSEAYKAGYLNICEIGKERIRRAGRKIKEEAGLTAHDLDIGFRVLRLDSSNMRDVYYNPAAVTQDLLSTMTDNIKPDRTPEDLLFQVMLDLGVELSSTIKETIIDGKKVFDVADGFLLACFDQGVTTETVTAIARRKPYYAVFRDSSMADDSTATNFDQIFETYSPNTVRKVL